MDKGKIIKIIKRVILFIARIIIKHEKKEAADIPQKQEGCQVNIEEARASVKGVCRSLDLLEQSVREKASRAIGKLPAMSYYVIETYRTYAVTEAYYAKGRKDKQEVDRLYAAAGIGLPDNYNIITQALPGTSKHCKGLAVDIAPYVNGRIIWDYGPSAKQYWEPIIKAFKDEGFVWGGDWDFKDYPHFELG